MLEIIYLREQKEEAIKRLAKRNIDAGPLLEEILTYDSSRRALKGKMDDVLAELNQLSKAVGELMKTGQREEAEKQKAKTIELKELSQKHKEEWQQLEDKIHDLLCQIPNAPHASVPSGKSAEDNEIVKEIGVKPTLLEGALPHWEIATRYNLINFELGVKISGAGFPVYINQGAKLQRALIQFFLDEAQKAGYTEYQVPHLVNADSGFGTGQLPDKEGQMYHATVDNLYLIPTAEVPLTNLFRDVILSEKDLPQKLTGYTPCFRREAGSYGKDVRGLNRLHQFDKVEIVQIAHPDKSYEILEEMAAHVAGLLDKLELPYRILRLCGGDMGFASAHTYDFETWSAAQQRWLEVSSTSNFETFQANRLKLRFKDKEGKTRLAHTLNGSALALPRILATILENNQTADGIKIPRVLIPYTGFDSIGA